MLGIVPELFKYGDIAVLLMRVNSSV